jgi:hypothetical protein
MAIAAPGTPWVGPRRSEQVRMPLKRGYGMGVAQGVSRGLPFIAFGWLLAGVIAAAVLRARRPAAFAALGKSSPLGP